MSGQDDFLAVIRHLSAVTGDPQAWQRGLSGAEILTVTTLVSPPAAVLAVVDKIRANYPRFFDAKTGAPITPGVPDSPAPIPQRGEAATAIKKAESDLAHQNSSTATLDLMVISAILSAHATSTDGAEKLSALQEEIEHAVQSRTDLDTAAGARDFQRFLADRLRQISAIIENAHLDDRSKAAMATAWTALYESTKRVAAPADTSPSPPSPSRNASAPPEPLRPYGAELPDDLLADPWAELGLAPSPPSGGPPVPPNPGSPAPAVPMPALPSIPATSPALAGAPASLPNLAGLMPAGLPRSALGAEGGALRDPFDGLSLEDLLAEEPGEETAEDVDAEPAPAPPPDQQPAPEEPSTEVRLPDGSLVTAPTPAVAEALRAVLTGTPVAEAYHRHGLPIPPPGSAVPHPVDPSRVSTGDVAMFSDRQVVALDRQRAFLDGRVQPISTVSGPSFLGWLHPPDSASSAPSSGPANAPTDTAKPAPTRPAVAGRAG
ncbi:DUF4226 domain-containing protein [Mycobacterium sp. ACS4331]|uniref:DUF4226 domain-containing protein n=1 Tax=Mycobacterium sp. ACS4331 TaxID=1834121 RepID=UPI0007FEA294|nr:DUF4226 domain-containing protein [Mycobacterium sp. ACS4331]OBF25930.1 hypothetical protein A5727_03795 [Mycobacterium sp. ACS4331]